MGDQGTAGMRPDEGSQRGAGRFTGCAPLDLRCSFSIEAGVDELYQFVAYTARGISIMGPPGLCRVSR